MYLGRIVSKSDLLVQQIDLNPREIQYVATYEHHTIDSSYNHSLASSSINHTGDICDLLFDKKPFSAFDHPISSCAAMSASCGFEKAIRNDYQTIN